MTLNGQMILILVGKTLEDYMPQVTTPNEIEGLDYTYGQKLMKFRNIDQIANMVAELEKRKLYSASSCVHMGCC